MADYKWQAVYIYAAFAYLLQLQIFVGPVLQRLLRYANITALTR